MALDFTVMTYNVHSCVGKDGEPMPRRIADVIASFMPDIVALQELDVKLRRSGLADQAELIAKHVEMQCHFSPCRQWEEGYYGNAILSRHPMRLVKAQALPGPAGRPDIEKRGALWVEINLEGCLLQVINTHLGLNRRERLKQAEALLGPDWIGHPDCNAPVIFCADLNALPRSRVYNLFKTRLEDGQCYLPAQRPGGTWPSRCPLLRIDHIFLSADIKVRAATVPRTTEACRASDHLPLVVRGRIDNSSHPSEKSG